MNEVILLYDNPKLLLCWPKSDQIRTVTLKLNVFYRSESIKKSREHNEYYFKKIRFISGNRIFNNQAVQNSFLAETQEAWSEKNNERKKKK